MAKNNYGVSFCCRPTGKLRVAQISRTLNHITRAFAIAEVFDDCGEAFKIDDRSILGAIRECMPEDESLGCSFELFAGTYDSGRTIHFLVDAGTDPGLGTLELLDASLGEGIDHSKIGSAILEKPIKILRPLHAFVYESNNSEELDVWEKEKAIPGFARPVVIHPIHYLSAEYVKNLGGTDHCMNCPAYKVEKLESGVMIVLTSTLFVPSIKSHLQAQKEAMMHFEMDLAFSDYFK